MTDDRSALDMPPVLPLQVLRAGPQGPVRAQPGRAPGIAPRVEALACALDEVIEQRWAAVLARHRPRLERRFGPSAPEALALYLRLVLRPITARLAAQGLVAFPRPPGGLVAPAEEPARAGGAQPRWFSTTVCTAADEPVGSLVTVLDGAGSGLAFARRPYVVGLPCVRVDEVQAAMRRRIGAPASG